MIVIKTKNVVAANDLATRIDLIKSKETEIEKASMSMSVTADNEINLNKFKRKCVKLMLINIVLFVKSQYIKILKQIWWTKFKKFWKINFGLKIVVNFEATTSFIEFRAILKIKMIL